MEQTASTASARKEGIIGYLLPLLALYVLMSHLLVPLLDWASPGSIHGIERLGLDERTAEFLYTLLASSVAWGLLMCLLTAIGLRLYGLTARRIGWTLPRYWAAKAALGLALGAGFYFLYYGLVKTFGDIVFYQRLPVVTAAWSRDWRHLSDPRSFNALFDPWVFGPVFEELFFRGFLYVALRKRFSWKAAAPAAAALFAFAHIPPLDPFRRPESLKLGELFGFGLICSGLLEWDGSLLTPIAAHAAFNFLASAALIRFDV